MTAKEFISIWERFSIDYIAPKESVTENEIIEKWTKDADWTKYIMGPGEYSKKGSLLGGYICPENGNLEYRTEYGKIDLVISIRKNYHKNIIDFKNRATKNETPLNLGHYPRTFEILIEHENNIERCWEEMVKLVQLKAKLKVLITYNYSCDEVELKNNELNIINATENFRNIISQSNNDYPENMGTQYLLIIGQRLNNKNRILWYYAPINSLGESIL